MARAPIALQLYSVRGECNKDLPATLKAVSALGYEGVEPYGYKGDVEAWLGWSGPDLRKMLDDHGLVCCGIHLSTDALLADNFQRSVSFNQALGNKFLIVSADAARMKTMDGIHQLADILNGVADMLAPMGMLTGYHAHGFDFETVEGSVAWDVLFANTEEHVVMQMDIGNCANGGGDPVGTLRKFPGRAKSVHLKDHGGPPGSALGEGEADWDEIFRLCETEHGTEWYIVEQGDPDGLGYDVCRRSLEALRRMGK